MRLKKYLITFMALLTIFTSFSANLLDLKADITGITPTGYTHTGTAINPSNPAYTTWFQKQSIDKITTNTGIGVCIEPWKLVGDWTGYNVSAYDNEQLSNIWYYAFVNTKQSNWDYAVGQLMVWEYFGYIPTAHSVPNYETRKAEINAAISKIKTVPSFHGERITMRVGESITLTDTNNVLSDYHGAKRENNGITFSQKDNQLTIFANQKAEETNTFHWDKIPASMVGQSFVHRKNNGQDVLTPMQNNPYSFHLTINVEKYGALNIGKVDEDGTAVPNTSFTLSYNADMSKPIGTYTTGTDGSVQIDQLLPQTIYYQEVSVPDHLILDSTIRSVTIVPNDTIRVTAQNKWKTGKIEITKKDKESGKVIISSPAAIQIYKEDGTFVKELQTVNGKTQAYTLRYGKYYYLETSTPNGYDINAEKHYFTISENGITVNSEINDVRTKVNLSIHKEDEETGTTSQGDSNVLDGAVYGLYARENIVDPADNHVIHTKNSEIARVTLKEGQASVYDQYCGQYYWKEITPPLGYIINTTEYDVDARYQSASATINTNTIAKDKVIKGKVQLFKTSSDGTSGVLLPLKDAQFTGKLLSEVERVGWEQAKTYSVITTNALGMATTADLPYGKYLFKETKTPDGKITAPDFTISINENEHTYFIAVNNAPFKSYVKMYKQDEQGNNVVFNQATFQIKDAQGHIVKQKVGDKYISEFTTDDKGYIQTPLMLEAGKYTIDEIKTPDGFLTIEQPIEFEITNRHDFDVDQDNDPVVIVKVKNKKPTAEIIVQKTFENEKDNALGGATFKLMVNSEIVDPASGKVLYHVGDPINMDIAENGLYTVNESDVLKISGLPMSTGKASYKLVEVSTIDGYVLDTKEYIFNFTQDNLTQKVYTQTVDIQNKQTTTAIVKSDIHNKALANATMQLLDEKGSVVEEWISDTNEHIIKGLHIGKTYTIHEVSAPDGYVLAKDVSFTVKNTTKKQTYTMLDTQVGVDKVHADTKKALAGAKFVVTNNQTKQIVDRWVNDGTTHYIANLVEGLSYTLSEIEAPVGFKKSEPIQFSVNTDKKIQMIKVANKEIHISTTAFNAKTLDKYFDAYGEINLMDKVSYQALEVGQTYTLTGVIMDKKTGKPLLIDGEEVKSEVSFTPEKENGFIEVNFTFNGDGLDAKELVVFETLTTKVNEKETIIAEHKDINDKKQTVKVRRVGDIQIMKVDAATNTVVKNKDFTFTLYKDKDCQEKVETVSANTKDGTALFKHVTQGTWYIKESAAPDGYHLSNEVVKVEIKDKGVFINGKQIKESDDVYSFTYKNAPIQKITTNDDSNAIVYLQLLGTSMLLMLFSFAKKFMKSIHRKD